MDSATRTTTTLVAVTMRETAVSVPPPARLGPSQTTVEQIHRVRTTLLLHARPTCYMIGTCRMTPRRWLLQRLCAVQEVFST